jgi:hypothetical protein
MKTTSMKVLLAISAFAVLAFTASAYDQVKGAQAQLGQPAKAVVSATIAPTTMNCSKCSDKLTASSTMAGRGAFLKVTFARTHTCGGCNTQTAITGFGKAKTTQTTHSCSAGEGNALCCAAH